MKLIELSCALIITLFITTGCASNPEKQAEKEAYFEEGKMDEQVQSWGNSGSRFK